MTRKRHTEPSFVSTQYPAAPGSTISSETTIIRNAHSCAFASTERSSFGFVTGAAGRIRLLSQSVVDSYSKLKKHVISPKSRDRLPTAMARFSATG